MILLAMLIAAADPCAAPAPAEQADPQGAQAYVEVGDAEEAAGAEDTARAAYEEALRLDPGSAAARRGLDEACAAARFDESRQRLDAGDAKGAAELLARVRAAAPSRPAALLEGIARYQLHDDGAARERLLEAEPEPELASAARFYLGLVALREGEARAAAEQLDQVAPDAPFASAARELARTAQRSGRLTLSLLADSGYDSNVTLLPSGVPGGGDALGALSAAAVAAPLGDGGPWLRATGLYRAQAQLHDYDLGAVGGAAGWRIGDTHHLALEYDYDYLALGAAPYLSAHRLAASGELALGSVSLFGGYAARFESYRTGATSPFSGVVHSGALGLRLRLGSGSLRAGYQVGRDLAQYAETSWVEHGPRVTLELTPRGGIRIAADADAAWRVYDDLDPALGVQRSDTILDGGVAGELDLTDHLSARAAIAARKTLSNVPELAYLRLSFTVGLLVSAGFF